MKIVFDTKVLIAAFATHGICHSLFEYAIENSTIVISEYILNELKEKFLTKFKMPVKAVENIAEFLTETCILSDFKRFPEPISRDVKDDPILGIIDLHVVDYLVSGDKDLLSLVEYKNVPIISPRELWNVFKDEG